MESKIKGLYIEKINSLYEQYIDIHKERWRSAYLQKKLFLQGILIALLTNYIISFLFKMDSIYPFNIIKLTYTIIFMVCVTALIIIYLNVREEFKMINRYLSVFNKLSKLDFGEVIPLIEKTQGKEYTDKLLINLVNFWEEQIKLKK